MTITEAPPVVLPDGRTLDFNEWFRIKGERGVYRADSLNPSGLGLWSYGGDRDPKGKRQWRCVPLDRIGATVKIPRGHAHV